MLYCGCGCTSPEQLRLWFSESEMKRLSALGYKAVKIDVDEVLGSSAVQVVFKRLKRLEYDVEPFELYPAHEEAVKK